MPILAYVVFLIFTYWLVLQIFRFSTYHAYFAKSLPFLIGYSIAVGFALYSIPRFHPFWFTQIWASALLFIYTWRRQAKRGRALMELTAEGPEQLAFFEISGASTRAYYTLSAVLYLTVYAISFLVFLNLPQR